MDQGMQEVKLFLDDIFNDLYDDEHVLTWASSRASPGFPISEDEFYAHQGRSKKPKACYFSTATVFKSDDNKLYNRQNLFCRMWCIVLDDIGEGQGSKCAFSALPPEMKDVYSWKIETSPDNFQLGFILEAPIDDLQTAQDFVQIIYGAGPWDSGGALCNKLVRLPFGVNLKTKYRGDAGLFEVRQLQDGEEDLRVFTPEDLLELVNAGVAWEDIVAGDGAKKNPRRNRGASAWREGVKTVNLDGVVDEGLEWLNDNNLILSESNEWIAIICPNFEEHTDDNPSAGYKPLGRGDGPETRAFKCFHDHCKDFKTRDFLNWVGSVGGPALSIMDPVPALVGRWALDRSTNDFIDLKSPIAERTPNAGFKNSFQSDVFWMDGEGKKQKATEFGLIVKSPGLLKLDGSRYEPGGDRIIEEGDKKRLNTWHTPNWQLKSKNSADFERFSGYLKYLMPYDGDAEWFLTHLAAKAQDPKYRGPCVLLNTPVQGSGRGTLADMLGSLWGVSNLSTVTLSNMIDGFSSEGFNSWAQCMWLVVPEARESGMTRRTEVRAYESLKSGIDPRPTMHLIKHKYGGEAMAMVYNSAIINSNHADMLNIPVTDRRFKRIECTAFPGTPKFFTEVNQWLEGTWCPGVWHGLLEYDTSAHEGFAPTNYELSEEEYLEAAIQSLHGQSLIDQMVTLSLLYCDEYLEGAVFVVAMLDCVKHYELELGLASIPGWESIYRKTLFGLTVQLTAGGKKRSFNINKKKRKLRRTLSAKGQILGLASDDRSADFTLIREFMAAPDYPTFFTFITECLADADMYAV